MYEFVVFVSVFVGTLAGAYLLAWFLVSRLPNA